MTWSMWQWNTKTWAQNFNTQQQLLSRHNKAKCPNKAQATHENVFIKRMQHILFSLSLLTNLSNSCHPPTPKLAHYIYIVYTYINVCKKKKKKRIGLLTDTGTVPYAGQHLNHRKKCGLAQTPPTLFEHFIPMKCYEQICFFSSNDKDVRQTH